MVLNVGAYVIIKGATVVNSCTFLAFDCKNGLCLLRLVKTASNTWMLLRHWNIAYSFFLLAKHMQLWKQCALINGTCRLEKELWLVTSLLQQWCSEQHRPLPGHFFSYPSAHSDWGFPMAVKVLTQFSDSCTISNWILCQEFWSKECERPKSFLDPLYTKFLLLRMLSMRTAVESIVLALRKQARFGLVYYPTTYVHKSRSSFSLVASC